MSVVFAIAIEGEAAEEAAEGEETVVLIAARDTHVQTPWLEVFV
jgi:hypothetical protein